MREDVGSCVYKDGKWKIDRQWYGQGMVFKSWEAYHERPDDPCYVPEGTDSVYSAADFLQMCNGQKEFADELFEGVDWQHPETLLEDWEVNVEWERCERCGTLIDMGNEAVERCPKCGKDMGEGGWP